MEFLKLSRVTLLNIALISSILCSCTILDPYIDRRRNPGTSNIADLYKGTSTPQKPSICYNPLLSNDAELQTLADAECIKHQTGTHAQYVKTQNFSCKLLLPSINYYKCIK